MMLKRIIAYSIDMVIVSFLSAMIFALLPVSKQYENYENQMSNYLEELLNSGSADIDVEESNNTLYAIFKDGLPVLTIELGLSFFYFGISAFLMKGQTIGKKIFKIKVVADDGGPLKPHLFMLRSVLVTNFIPEIMIILILMFGSKELWINTNVIISYISKIMTFLMVGFALFRDDNRGLHDIIAKTKVVLEEKNE